MKLLCFGDVHLGQGAELGRQPGDRLLDQSRVLKQIYDLASDRHVDAILCAGDVFEGPGIPPEQLDLFATFVAACHDDRISIVSITGNGKHDAAVRATNGLDIFRHIPGIRISSTPELVEVAGVTVATLPWVHPGRYIAQHARDVSRDETNSVVAELLLEAARGLRAQISEDAGPAILLLHWSVDCASLPNGLPVADLREPVLSWDELDAAGFDFVVAGHIHKQQTFGDSAESSLGGLGFYVGSPLPLNFGEANDEHGVWILDFTDGGALNDFEFIPIASRPLVTLQYDFTEHADVEMLDLFPPATGLDNAIVRVKYRATADQARSFDVSLLKRELHSYGAAVVKIVPDIIRADRARVEGVNETLTTMQALELYLAANQIDPVLADAMRAKSTEYLEAAA